MDEDINKEENVKKNNIDNKSNKEDNENSKDFPIEINNFQNNEILASQMLDVIFQKIDNNEYIESENKSNYENDELKSNNEELENKKEENSENNKNKEINKNDTIKEKFIDFKNNEEVSD